MPSMSSIVQTDSQLTPEQQAQIEVAAGILKQGGLVAFPTETVYGLGADAENAEALARLYAVKGRPGTHPVIVHLSDAAQLSDWAVDIPADAWHLAEAFWPGPMTLILPRSSRVPDAVTGGQETVGLRVPAHPAALALLKAFGGGIAAPSANRFGRLSPTQAAHVQADLGTDVDMILEGDACNVGVESTIIAFQQGQPVILRPGMITEADVAAVLSEAPVQIHSAEPVVKNETEQQSATVIRAPGTLASHYAPHTSLALVNADDLSASIISLLSSSGRVGVLACRPQLRPFSNEVVWLNAGNEPEAYARTLYANLRALDDINLSHILVEAVPDTGAWAAVNDRLRRAAFKE